MLDDTKPDLKLVVLKDYKESLATDSLEEEEELTEEENLYFLYYQCRDAFLGIEDVNVYNKAIKKLRLAFLLAVNPLGSIDEEFED